MESDPFGSDPLFEGRLHGIGSRTVGVYTGSDPCRFYDLLAFHFIFFSFHFIFFKHGNPVGKGRFSGGRDKNLV